MASVWLCSLNPINRGFPSLGSFRRTHREQRLALRLARIPLSRLLAEHPMFTTFLTASRVTMQFTQ
jgi:hypothetical protein